MDPQNAPLPSVLNANAGGGAQSPGLVLNYDILIYIMDFLRWSLSNHDTHGSLFSMMQTCKTLYDAGTPIILHRDIRLSGEASQIEAFNSFMLRNCSHRCSFVRELSLSAPRNLSANVLQNNTDRSQGDTLREFAHVIQNCHNLEHIILYEPDQWFLLEPRLALAFASLRKVESAAVGMTVPHTFAIGDLLQWSNLKSIEFGFAGRENDTQRSFGDPRVHLEGLADVDTLCVQNMELYPDYDDRCFPKIQSINIDNWRGLETDILARSFPNLRYLCLRNDRRFRQRLLEHRIVNIHAQSHYSWSSLTGYTGDIESLYALAPRCRISSISTTVVDNATYIPNILRDSMPSRLRLTVNYDSHIPYLCNSVSENEDLPLTHLSFSARISARALHAITDINSSTLDFLRCIGSNVTLVLMSCNEDHGESELPADFWDPEDIKQRMGSLRFLCLRISSNGAKYWKVERSETDVTLISVDRNEGKEIIEREFSVDV